LARKISLKENKIKSPKNISNEKSQLKKARQKKKEIHKKNIGGKLYP